MSYETRIREAGGLSEARTAPSGRSAFLKAVEDRVASGRYVHPTALRALGIRTPAQRQADRVDADLARLAATQERHADARAEVAADQAKATERLRELGDLDQLMRQAATEGGSTR